MKSISNIIHIYRKYGNLFSIVNREVLREGNQYIGASINGKKRIMLKADMMATCMPELVGVQTSNPDFLKLVHTYWDSISVFIPEQGVALEVGFVYNLDDSSKTKAINELAKKLDVKIETADKLAELVESRIEPNERWKYGTPINTRDYVLFEYCKGYAQVANSSKDAMKSEKIRFFIHDESSARKEQKAIHDLRNKAGKLYYGLVGKETEVETVLYALSLGDQLDNKDAAQKEQMLYNAHTSAPAKFVAIAEDKNLKEIAYIEQLIAKNLLKRDFQTKYISDPATADILGKTAKEVAAFLKDAKNAKLANELQGMLKHS